MTDGPSDPHARPAYSRPWNGQPRAAISFATGTHTSSTMRCTPSAGSQSSGAYAPMPPVFGPSSLSNTRLWSCAGCNGTTVSPSTRQNKLTSGPSRNDSNSTGLPPDRTSFAWAMAAARSCVTTTPLPAARPSSLTTQFGPKRSIAASMSASEAPGSIGSAWAVFTPAAAITSFANAFDPSIRAASLFGPNTGKPSARMASPTPATSGTSGPITTSSGSISFANAAHAAGSSTFTECSVARLLIPALPGATCRSGDGPPSTGAATCGSLLNAYNRACSRAPEPITRIRMPAILPMPRTATPSPIGPGHTLVFGGPVLSRPAATPSAPSLPTVHLALLAPSVSRPSLPTLFTPVIHHPRGRIAPPRPVGKHGKRPKWTDFDPGTKFAVQSGFRDHEEPPTWCFSKNIHQVRGYSCPGKREITSKWSGFFALGTKKDREMESALKPP